MAKEYLPLSLIRQTENSYPGCWNNIELLRREKGKSISNWDDLCYIPIAGTIAVITKGETNPDMHELKNRILDAAGLAALAPWRLNKYVYVYTEELEQILYQQATNLEKMDMPIEILLKLPHTCIYIESPNLDENCHGFFVHFENDVSTDNPRRELRFFVLYKDKTVAAHMIHLLQGKSIYDCMYQTITEGIRQAVKLEAGVPYTLELLDAATKVKLLEVNRMLQLVLYLCADNTVLKSEVALPVKLQQVNTQADIKDKYREIIKYSCGKDDKLGQIKELSSHNDFVKYETVGLENSSWNLITGIKGSETILLWNSPEE